MTLTQSWFRRSTRAWDDGCSGGALFLDALGTFGLDVPRTSIAIQSSSITRIEFDRTISHQIVKFAP